MLCLLMPGVPLTEGYKLHCPAQGAVKVHTSPREPVHHTELLLRCYRSFAENEPDIDVEESNGSLREGETLAVGPVSWFPHL